MRTKIIIISIVIALLKLINILKSGKNPNHDIVIIYTNDIHCAVEEEIGYAGLNYYKKQIEKRTPYVTLVDAGDAVQGATIGSISKGSAIIDIMNAMNYDIAVPGNHEFDYGMEQFEKLAKNLTCGYLSCNFRQIKTNELIFKPYRIIEYGDVKVAYIGITTPVTIIKASPAFFKNNTDHYVYDFDGDKLYESVQKAVDDARDDGANYVIAVGHIGENNGEKDEWRAPFIVKNTKGIDVFIDGHSHETTPMLMQKNLENKEIPITQSGTRLINIGQVTIGMDGTIKTELINSKEITSKDDYITDFIQKIKSLYEYKLKELIGHSDFDLILTDKNGKWIIRNSETNLGNLIADAFLSEAEVYGGADIAICNSGNIRAPIKAGDITYNDIISVLPFTISSCIYEMPGQTILDALEMGARSYPDEDPAFLHTAGLNYSIDTGIKSTIQYDSERIFIEVSGERRVYNVTVNGQPLDPKRQYKVIGDSYILQDEGDGYVFHNSTLINSDFALPSELLANYIKKFGEIPKKYSTTQRRINVGKKKN